MIVITADQVDSRLTADLATDTLAMLNADFARGLLLSADRTAGDEIQLLVRDGRTAVDVVLALTRAGESVYARVVPMALQYERNLVAPLSVRDLATLDRLVRVLLGRAVELGPAHAE